MDLNKGKVNLITASLLLSFNIMLLFLDDSGGVSRVFNISIPLLLFVFMSIFKNKNIYLFYTIVGVLVTIKGTPDNFSPAIFFFLSAYDNKSKTNIYLNFILMILSLSVKYYINDIYIAEMSAMPIAYFFTLSHMYIRFWPTSPVDKEESHSKGLTPEQIETIEMLMKGVKHGPAAEALNIERKTYSARVSGLRKRYNVESDFQLAIALQKDGIISSNSLAKAQTED